MDEETRRYGLFSVLFVLMLVTQSIIRTLEGFFFLIGPFIQPQSSIFTQICRLKKKHL